MYVHVSALHESLSSTTIPKPGWIPPSALGSVVKINLLNFHVHLLQHQCTVTVMNSQYRLIYMYTCCLHVVCHSFVSISLPPVGSHEAGCPEHQCEDMAGGACQEYHSAWVQRRGCDQSSSHWSRLQAHPTSTSLPQVERRPGNTNEGVLMEYMRVSNAYLPQHSQSLGESHPVPAQGTTNLWKFAKCRATWGA